MTIRQALSNARLRALPIPAKGWKVPKALKTKEERRRLCPVHPLSLWAFHRDEMI